MRILDYVQNWYSKKTLINSTFELNSICDANGLYFKDYIDIDDIPETLDKEQKAILKKVRYIMENHYKNDFVLCISNSIELNGEIQHNVYLIDVSNVLNEDMITMYNAKGKDLNEVTEKAVYNLAWQLYEFREDYDVIISKTEDKKSKKKV